MSQLTIGEREIIMIMLENKRSKRAIARKLGRNPQSICDEIDRNSVRGKYIAHKACHKAYVRRLHAKRNLKKIRKNDKLEKYIREKVNDDRSPEMVAGRWNKRHEEVNISVPTIYKYVHSRFAYDLLEHLYSNRKGIRRKKSNKNKSGGIKHRTFIDARPAHISQLTEFGHYECDLIVGPQGTKEVLLVIIEKKTRRKIAKKLPNKKAKTVEIVLQKWVRLLGIKSITFDNGVEFANHYKLGIPTYFSHPYHSREKAQVERGNRDYRRYFPKKTQRKKISQKEIDTITEKLNNMPMKVLKFNTPNEVFHTYFRKYFQVSVFTL